MDDGSVELLKLVGTGGGGIVAWKIVETLIGARFKKADKTEEHAEAAKVQAERAVAEDVKQLRADMSEVKTDLRVLLEKLSRNDEEVRAVKARVEGLSSNYGARLAALEATVVEVKTKLASVEDSRRVRK
jgi:ABC-type transporter Mla subunit MlaD